MTTEEVLDKYREFYGPPPDSVETHRLAAYLEGYSDGMGRRHKNRIRNISNFLVKIGLLLCLMNEKE